MSREEVLFFTEIGIKKVDNLSTYVYRAWNQNSLAPGKFEWNFKYVIFKQILGIDCWSLYCEIALIWMSLDCTGDESTLVHVMVWCHQATSHYVSQCWPRSLSSYGVTRPQRVEHLVYMPIGHMVLKKLGALQKFPHDAQSIFVQVLQSLWTLLRKKYIPSLCHFAMGFHYCSRQYRIG